MSSCNRLDVALTIVSGAVIATAGYVGAWFAAGPSSALANPMAGAVVALAAAVIYAVAGKKVFQWTEQQFPNNPERAIMSVVTVVSLGAIIAANLCGFPVGLDDITVLTIGLFVGVPFALIGLAVALPLVRRVSQIF